MSGPKHSNFRVMERIRRQQEQERRRKLEEERRRKEAEQRKREEERRRMQEEERKKREGLREIAQLQKKLENKNQSLVAALQPLLEEGEHSVPRSLGLAQLREVKKEWDAQMRQVPSLSSSPTLAQVQELCQMLQRLNQQFDRMQGELNDWIAQLQENISQEKQAEAERSFLEKAKQWKPVERKVFSLTAEPEQPAAAEEVSEDEVSAALEELEEILSPYLTSPLIWDKGPIQQLIHSTQEMVLSTKLSAKDKCSYIEQRKKAFLATASVYQRGIEQNEEAFHQFQQLSTAYESYCTLLETVPDHSLLSFDPAKAAEAIRMLEAANRQAEEEWRQKQETDYIARCVHEVMKELDYDIIATDFMHTPKRNIQHQMFEFEADCAINVFTSDNGSLLFEVTGVSEQAKELTSHDQVRIREAMETFCPQYQKIKERLREKGIELTNENLLPAHEQFAKIIDLSTKQRVGGQRKGSTRSAQHQRYHQE